MRDARKVCARLLAIFSRRDLLAMRSCQRAEARGSHAQRPQDMLGQGLVQGQTQQPLDDQAEDQGRAVRVFHG